MKYILISVVALASLTSCSQLLLTFFAAEEEIAEKITEAELEKNAPAKAEK